MPIPSDPPVMRTRIPCSSVGVHDTRCIVVHGVGEWRMAVGACIAVRGRANVVAAAASASRGSC